MTSPRQSRAKPIDPSQAGPDGFVYGWYVEILGFDKTTTPYIAGTNCGIISIIPPTVGQDTGKKDKNGKATYFGQRLKDKTGIEYTIVWIDMMAAFWVIQTEYPYKKYTAELISKLEVIHDKEQE